MKPVEPGCCGHISSKESPPSGGGLRRLMVGYCEWCHSSPVFGLLHGKILSKRAGLGASGKSSPGSLCAGRASPSLITSTRAPSTTGRS